MSDDVLAAAALLADPARAAGLSAGLRQQVLEAMASPKRVELEGTAVHCYVHSVTEDARIRKFKEPWTIEWLRTLPANAVLYDVGANIGITSLIAVENLARNVTVVAVEPAPANFASLVKNISFNGFSHRIIALPIGLGSATDVMALHLTTWEPGGAMHSFGDFQPVKTGKEVRSQGLHFCLRVRLDDLVRWEGLPFPTHIKVDVDASELDLLLGARDVFRDPRCRAAQIEAIDPDNAHQVSAQVLEFMAAAGFVVVARHPHDYGFPRVTDYQFCRL